MSTIRRIAIRTPVLHCPLCKKPLEKTNGEYICRGCSKVFPIVDGIPSLVDCQETADSFDALAFEFLFQMERKHFWHVGRREIILDVLRRNIPDLAKSKMLEIGCGNGNILWYLKQNGINIEGGDMFLEGLSFCRKRAGSVALYQIDVLALPFDDNFDVIGAFDVLEHIDEDDKALAEMSRALKTGGNLILTVPAHGFLWSYFDEASRHKRRYGKNKLIAKLEEAGFTIKKASYYMFFLFPLLAVIRLIGNARQHRNDRKINIKASLELRTVPIVNEVFLGLLRLERFLLRYFNLPFGTSLIVLAEKK